MSDGLTIISSTSNEAEKINTVIEFTVPGTAVPWARAGVHGKVHFTPAKQRSYAGVLKLYCQRAMAGRAPIEGPVELSVVAKYVWPKSWSARRRREPAAQWKTSRPDRSNIEKLIEDALNELAWRDDAQVVSGHCWKIYAEEPSLTVRIRALA